MGKSLKKAAMMIKEVSVGTESLQVLQAIVSLYPDIQTVRVILHNVSRNWRQRNTDTKSKMENMHEGVMQCIISPIMSNQRFYIHRTHIELSKIVM